MFILPKPHVEIWPPRLEVVVECNEGHLGHGGRCLMNGLVSSSRKWVSYLFIHSLGNWLLKRTWYLLPFCLAPSLAMWFLHTGSPPPSAMSGSSLRTSPESDAGACASCTPCRTVSKIKKMTQPQVCLHSNTDRLRKLAPRSGVLLQRYRKIWE